jgi:type IV pilus assembly protein PilW
MRRAAGFTLVELMIATSLVLLGVAGALSLVARGRGAYRSVEAHAQLEETARAALDMLAYEVRMAGHLGLLAPGSNVIGAMASGTVPPPELAVGGGCTDALALDLGEPLAGADGAFAAGPDVALDCDPSPLGRAVPGADTFIVRRTAPTAAAPDPGRLQLESSRWEGRLMTDGQRQLGDDSAVHDIEASVFYVSQDATGATGRPSLRRKRLVGGSAPSFQDEELVPGVEDLQVEFGFTGGDNTAVEPVQYVPIDAVPDDSQVHSVRLWVLVRSESGEAAAQRLPALAYANRRLEAEVARHPRLLVSRTIAVRNLETGR